MKTKRTSFIGLLSIILLVLAGGLAYAATSGTSHGYHPQTAVTAIATPGSHSQHPASQPGHRYQASGSDWRCCGGWYGGWNYGHQGHGSQGHQGYPGSQGRHCQHHGTQHHGYQHHGYQHHGRGYQGGSHGGHRWGNGNGCCGGSWH
jgi:hypothetical protein